MSKAQLKSIPPKLRHPPTADSEWNRLLTHTTQTTGAHVFLGLLVMFGEMKWSLIERYGCDMLLFLLARDSYVYGESATDVEIFHWSHGPPLFVIESRRLLGFCIRSTGEDSSLLHGLLPPLISILVYAGSLIPSLFFALPLRSTSPRLFLSFNTSSIFVSASLVKLPHQLRMAKRQFMSLVDFPKMPRLPIPTYDLSVSSFPTCHRGPCGMALA